MLPPPLSLLTYLWRPPPVTMARTEEPIEAISAARSCAANRRVHTVGGIGLGHYRFEQQHMRFMPAPIGQLCNVR